MPSKKPVRFGIIGASSEIAKSHHIPAIEQCPDAVLAKRFVRPAVETAECFDTFFRDLDVVMICTPDHTHARYMAYCHRADIITLVEKPVSLNQEELTYIRQARDSAFMTVGFHHRFFGQLIGKLKGIYQENSSTRSKITWASNGTQSPWREALEPATLIPLGSRLPHLLDLLSIVFDGPPVEIEILDHAVRHPLKGTCLHIELTYTSVSWIKRHQHVVELFVAEHAVHKVNHWRILSDKICAEFEKPFGARGGAMLQTIRGSKLTPQEILDCEGGHFLNPYAKQVRALVDWVRHPQRGKPPQLASLAQGLDNAQLLLDIHKRLA